MNKSQVPTKQNLGVSNNIQRNDQIERVYTKELNIYGKMGLFGIYTGLCIFLGGLFFPQGDKIDLSALDNVQNNHRELLQKITQLEGDSNFDTTRLMQVNTSLVDKLEGRVLSAISSEYNRSAQTITKQKGEIIDLKNRIENLLTVSSIRSPASVENKSFIYNLENMSVFRYEHRQERILLSDNQIIMKDAFLKTVDLTLGSDRKKWKSFKAEQDLEYYKLKQKHYAEERRFRNTGHRLERTATY